MQGELIHYLNGNVVEEPGNWKDFTEEIERSYSLRLIASQYPNSITFRGEGYAILRNAYLQALCDAFDYRCDFICQGQAYNVARGEIKISDIEWNLNKCEADVKIADDGYGARINNNKSIKVAKLAETSKNGVQIGACPSIDLLVFDPTAPEPDYRPQTSVAFDWLEAMNHTIRFITDDIITVESPWYDALPEDEKYCILYGAELNTPTGLHESPTCSFKDLFENMWKKYNLWAIVMRNDQGQPVLRIIQDADTFSDSVVKSFPNQDDLKQSVDLDQMYSSVKLGDEEALKDESNLWSLPFLPMVGFTIEEYFIEGVCNIDSTLDLTEKFVYDSNAIESIVASTNTDLDEKIFLLQYTPYLVAATKGDYLDPGNNPYLYNEQLLNLNIANRWRLQAAGVQNYNTPDANFRADRTIAVANPTFATTFAGVICDSVRIVQYDDDYTLPNFDTDNSYGNGTAQGTPVTEANSRYTAPATGYYVFQGYFPWQLISNPVGAISQGTSCQKNCYVTVTVSRYNLANTLINATSFTSDVEYAPGFYSFTWTRPTIMNTGDYIIWYYQLCTGAVGSFCPLPPFASYSASLRAVPGAYVYTSFVATGGGDITGSDPDEYRTVVYTFDRSMPIEDWVGLRDDPRGMIQVATDDTSMRKGHILKAVRNVSNGSCEWELIANRAQQFK